MKALPHSRGQIQYAELGCTHDGDFTGLRVRLVGDAGAYPTIGAFLPGGTRRMAQGTYAFPTIEFDVAVAVTNTTPMGAYRGAGRPEATALLERLVDQAALELGIDPIEIRRRNFLGDDVFPFPTLTGNTYDIGPLLRSRSTVPPSWPATTSCEPSRRGVASAGDAIAARHRRGRRTSRSPPAAAPTSSARSRCTTTARRRSTPAPCPTVRATRPRTR